MNFGVVERTWEKSPSAMPSTRLGVGAFLRRREIRQRSVIVRNVLRKHVPQMGLIEHDHVIEALATNGSDQALDVVKKIEESRVLEIARRLSRARMPRSVLY